MSQPSISDSAISTSQLLDKLGMAVNETRLVRAMDSIRNDIFKAESSEGLSKHSLVLRSELARLQVRLTELRQLSRSA